VILSARSCFEFAALASLINLFGREEVKAPVVLDGLELLGSGGWVVDWTVLLAGALEDAVEDQEVLAAPQPGLAHLCGVNGVGVDVEIPITVSSYVFGGRARASSP
jgi:hypothetical protein